MQDRAAILQFCLEKHYIAENEALANQLSAANREIARQNQEIENLQDAVVMLQTEINTYENQHRILVDRNGRRAVFRRNFVGVFEEVVEEPLREVRRRLNFDVEDDVDERELMDRLMFGTP
jgi:uncharacterized coiled-coil protein SlyX